ncbi:alkaline phosphatase [Consotaella aegiceratis]|uniref:alkaline phosphatase n=1 Tax=Consotaella aegiceratis TaxID=3097961 RepID=UPI002F3EE4E8
MNKLVALGLASALMTTAAYAQDIAQQDSQWYKDAQTKIQEMVARQPNTNRAKNVILLIADGMGIGTNYAIRLYDGQQKGMMGEENVLPYEAFPNLALVKTYNINAQTPDSAPTAGSMNTGVKQQFNLINLNENARWDDCSTVAGNELTTFAEMMSEEGKSVGVVTTARITHATPAAVYAKTANRDWEDKVSEGCTAQKDIASQLVDAMKSGEIDLAMGGGREYFVPKGTTLADQEQTEGHRPDSTNLIEDAEAAGIQYAWNTETAKQLKLDGETPVLALFEDSHMKYEADRTDEDEPSLTEMTRMAIEYLQNNSENGYYLEIESGRVDHANHDGNAYRTVTDGVEFAKAVAMADEMTDDEDTLIIVTADHEHSIALNGYCGRGSPILGLCYEVDTTKIEHADTPNLGSDGKPYTVIGYLNGPGSVLIEQEGGAYSGERPDLTQEEAEDTEYLQQSLIPMSSESHSGEDVAVWAKGPWSHLFDGVIEQNYIFHVMDYAVSAGQTGSN